MSRLRQMVAVAAIGAAAVSAFATQVAFGASGHAASAGSVKVASVSISGHGKHSVLVTSSGHAVYLLTGDSTSHPKCTSSDCLGDWPAVTGKSKKPTLGKGVKGKLTVWTHGKMHQLVLNGHPLYTFAEDSSMNSANGQGLKSFGGTWELLTASGAGYTSASKSSSSSGGGGSGW